jgi:hypothetical protein
MTQKQTTIGYWVKEGSGMISMSPDASGVLMSGVNNKFNLPEQQQSIFLGDPTSDHVIRKEDLPGTSQSGETTLKEFLFAQKVGQYVECLLANCMIYCDSCFIHKLGITRARLSLHQLILEDVFVSSIFWTLE